MNDASAISAAPSAARLQWWTVIGLLFALMALPGPERSPFSGIPFSSQTLFAFMCALVAAAFSGFFPPRAQVGMRWIGILALLVALKVWLSLSPVQRGWHASYWTGGPDQTWTQVRFQGKSATVADYRIDQELQFEGATWGLHFINDLPTASDWSPIPRDQLRPLKVRWTGHIDAGLGTTFEKEVSASGTVRIGIDDRPPVEMIRPERQPFRQPLGPGPHVVVIEYEKPANEIPSALLLSPPLTVTAHPASRELIERAAWLTRAAAFFGLLALFTVILLFARAYWPLVRLLLADIWLAPARSATLVFFGYFALTGALGAIPQGASTPALTVGDDALVYEGQARQIVFNGILMTDEHGAGRTYYQYPLYSYALAAAHLLFGEEFATIVVLNYLSVAALGFALYFFLRRYLTEPATALALFAAALFMRFQHLPYAATAFSDNLYIIMVWVTLAVAVAAFENRGQRLMWVAGSLTALTAATRPSFLFFAPVFALAILSDPSLGGVRDRVRRTVAYSVGFLCGVAPFTIRNWLVAHRFVLLVSSFVMLPWFLYHPEEIVPAHRYPLNSGLVKSVHDFAMVWMERPAETAWVEARKVLFSLGLMRFGPNFGQSPSLPQTLPIWPLLFGFSLWLGRVPHLPAVVLVVFVVSHIIAMVVGAPWTYGYKSILPLHLAFLIGASFLLPRWGDQWWRARVNVPRRLPTRQRTISVLLPTYNERDSIRSVIEDFFATGIVNEVIVINNNAVHGTSEEVARTRAREVLEPRQGYGAAIRRGLIEARGDLIVICEPDGTFLARDITKLLAFADDFDVVFGSRTSQQFIWTGANMGLFLRWGNWAVAKYMQFLYNATNLTDVGCTMRLLRREVAEQLRDQFRVDGSQFGPEMMVLSLREQFQVIQVPVNYLPRVGESAVTGDLGKALILGLQMIWLITWRRFEDIGRRPLRPERSPMIERAP